MHITDKKSDRTDDFISSFAHAPNVCFEREKARSRKKEPAMRRGSPARYRNVKNVKENTRHAAGKPPGTLWAIKETGRARNTWNAPIDINIIAVSAAIKRAFIDEYLLALGEVAG